MNRGEDFGIYLKEASQMFGNHGHHLSEEEMIAYYQGRAAAAERDSAQAHLAACSACLQSLQDVRDLFGPRKEEVSAAEVRQNWEELWAQMQAEKIFVNQEAAGISAALPARTATRGIASETQRVRSFFRAHARLALAACLALSLVPSGILAWRLWLERQEKQQAQQQVAELHNGKQTLEQQLSELQRSGSDQLNQERKQKIAAETRAEQLQAQLNEWRQSQQNIPVLGVNLAAERGAGEGLRVEVPPTAKTFMLSLRFSGRPYEFPKYTIEILNQRGQTALVISELKPVLPAGTLNLMINRAELDPGKYRLRIFGQRDGVKRQLGEHELSLSFLQ
jgi:hypothetical protein